MTSAGRLSGGEKVLLGISFRVAVNSMFAIDLGLLVLDEPTAGLDKGNLACLHVAFERLRELSRSRGLQIVMALFVVAGFVGVAAHFNGSAEFQLDLDPEIGTWELLEKVMRAKAPPLLAPGMMLQMGLLGLAYVYSDVRYRVRALRALGFSLQKE